MQNNIETKTEEKSNLNHQSCIGILAETKNVWERRVSLSPSDCKTLIEKGIKVLIQPSMTRCFSDSEYTECGVEISKDLSKANLILAIQNPDIQNLYENKTYMFFSHTRKGQTDNPFLLEKILEKKIRLLDYECIKEKSENFLSAKRLVSFGKIAGVAGTINILKGIGELLLSRNISTPFVFTKLAHMYCNEKFAKENLIMLGKFIQEQYLPEDLCPFTFAVLGNGRVSAGVLEALECLPHMKVTPQELLSGSLEKRRDLVYIVLFKPEDLYVKVNQEKDIKDFDSPENLENKNPNKVEAVCEGEQGYFSSSSRKNSDEDMSRFAKSNFSFRSAGSFNNSLGASLNKNDLHKNPEKYICNFNDVYLKYFHCIINCLYWESCFPKIFTKENLRSHITHQDSKLLAISDISCDLNGAIEILTEYTSFRKPFFIYEPVTKQIIYDIDQATKEGIIYHAIPNLASSFPEDASNIFSNLLLPFMEKLAKSRYPAPLEEQTDIPEELVQACVASNGVLTPKYRNLFRNSEEKARSLLSQEKQEKPYFAKFKIKGHIFDSGFFHEMINIFPKYDVGHKIGYLKIGENVDFPSVFYFDVYAQNKENIKAFQGYLDEKSKQYQFELDLMKTNI